MYADTDKTVDFHRNGYILLENVFSPEEVAAMLNAVETGPRVSNTTRPTTDGSGGTAKLAIWHELGEDIWSAVSTCPRIVNTLRILMGEEIAFFHGKVMLKEAREGGAWEWHQDYGYWYNQGFTFPRMASAFIPLEPATLENGCLRVLRGSHRLGRLNHIKIGTQTGADPERIAQIEPLFEPVACEMEPGSVLFFHCNLLHSSAPNTSDRHRRAFIICYNALANPQLGGRQSAEQRPCPVASDTAILEYARTLQTAQA